MQIKTVSHANEDKFDAEVNDLLSKGWKVDASTYRTCPITHSGGLLGDGGHGGCYNSIILTKD